MYVLHAAGAHHDAHLGSAAGFFRISELKFGERRGGGASSRHSPGYSLSLSHLLSRAVPQSSLPSLSLSLTNSLTYSSHSLSRSNAFQNSRRYEAANRRKVAVVERKTRFDEKSSKPAEFFAEKGRFSTGPVVVSDLRDDGDPELGRSSVRRPGKRTSR